MSRLWFLPLRYFSLNDLNGQFHSFLVYKISITSSALLPYFYLNKIDRLGAQYYWSTQSILKVPLPFVFLNLKVSIASLCGKTPMRINTDRFFLFRLLLTILYSDTYFIQHDHLHLTNFGYSFFDEIQHSSRSGNNYMHYKGNNFFLIFNFINIFKSLYILRPHQSHQAAWCHRADWFHLWLPWPLPHPCAC